MRAHVSKWLLMVMLAGLATGCGSHGMASGLRSGGGFQASNELLEGAGRFTLATYNVENLFDGSTVKLDGKLRKAKPEEEKKALAATFHAMNADVVGLVEVESEPTLRKFRDQYLADMGYKHLALVEGNDPRGIDVAVLSRFPIASVKSHKNVSFAVPGQSGKEKFSRDLLQATIKPHGGYQFTLFVAHLKSQLGGEPADQKRQAEAAQVNAILQGFEKSHERSNYALVGDLNDTVAAPALGTLFNPNKRIGKLFDSLGELGSGAFTYHPEKYRSRIDHILLSRSMAVEYEKGSAKIVASSVAEQASDHFPAVVTIDGRRNMAW